ncbi:lipoprotein signal peptidase [Tepidicaulis marinus]|uniref:Lipoprotein signal peptidase n=1 Tax=Tepidicaulis marinus TaxID=1333998 RepID=A0A081BA95_9HYPH|nr:signal peptidase II [Tepidicaulis marinus]GAK44963.1 lipoprotein signal peptidase [Tepidicaulis marinus]
MKLPQIRPLWGRLSALGFAVAIAGFLSDRLSKWWLLDVYGIGERGIVEITPFFNLVMAWNKGVSYGLFTAETAAGRAILIGFALLVTVLLGLWLARVTKPYMAVALGLIIGGAVGNVYDRVKFGAVADFFSFHIDDVFYWYIFNIADVWIVAGVGLMLVDAVFPGKEPDSAQK